ncbi:glucocerebrosidase 1b isoform X2 [Lycorma delicatula]
MYSNYVTFFVLELFLLSETAVHFVTGDSPCQPHIFSHGFIGCVCNATYCDTIDPVMKLPAGEFIMYTSNEDGLRFAKTSGQFQFYNLIESDLVFQVNKSVEYQKIFGFGGAFTDSAGINILSLSKEVQDNLLRSYFSPQGIEYNFGRVPIGGSDFSTRKYTLDDAVNDVTLKNFSLAFEDFTYKIPLIKRAQAMSDRKINLLGTAWTAPPWMKTNNDYTGFGFLRKEFYQLWAAYHIKFLEAYKKEGLDFWGLTTGNEPLNGFLPYIVKINSMGWFPVNHGNWIAENLGPLLRTSEFNFTKIIAFDDQRLLLSLWINKLLSNRKAMKFIDGIGIHWYWDFIIPVSVVQNVHDSYPDKFIINTEASQGDKPWEKKVVPGSWKRGELYVDDIIEDLNNWMSGWLEWNLAVDMKGGPNWANNFVDSPILVDAKNDVFYKQPMFYALGHFSKFIKPGAVRIYIAPTKYKNVNVLAVLNEDESIVVILHNRSAERFSVILEDAVRGKAVIVMEPFSFNTVIYW